MDKGVIFKIDNISVNNLIYFEGYLGHVLSSVYKRDVISLESKQCHTRGAEQRETGQYREYHDTDSFVS